MIAPRRWRVVAGCGSSSAGVVAPHEGSCGGARCSSIPARPSGRVWAGGCWSMSRRSAAAVNRLEPTFAGYMGFSLRQALAGGELVSGDPGAAVSMGALGVDRVVARLRSPSRRRQLGIPWGIVRSGSPGTHRGRRVARDSPRSQSRLAQGAVGLLKLDAGPPALIAKYPKSCGLPVAAPDIAGAPEQVDAVIAAVVLAADAFTGGRRGGHLPHRADGRHPPRTGRGTRRY